MVSSGNARGGRARANRGWPQSCVRACTEIGSRGLVLATMRPGGDFCDDRAVRPTVLIVDDHDGFRESARALLEAEGFTVVGDAADGAAAVAAVARLRPDVVLLDIQLPGADGFAVAGRLAAGPDPPRVVLISSREAAAYGPRVGAAPVCGFLAKRELSGAALAVLVR
jgi:CheY-like chemotaxis protein